MEGSMISMIEISCCSCGKNTMKKLAEIKRRKKKGKTKFYCSRSCASKASVDHLKKYAGQFNHNLIASNRYDKYSDFRWYIKNVIKNSKKRNQTYDVDLEYLYSLWNKQNGICPFTKQKIELRTHNYTHIENRPYQASLDRIDSSIGYLKGNVQFISIAANHAKGNLSHEDMILFCNLIYENKKASPK
jgi:hypothetical protein